MTTSPTTTPARECRQCGKTFRSARGYRYCRPCMRMRHTTASAPREARETHVPPQFRISSLDAAIALAETSVTLSPDDGIARILLTSLRSLQRQPTRHNQHAHAS